MVIKIAGERPPCIECWRADSRRVPGTAICARCYMELRTVDPDGWRSRPLEQRKTAELMLGHMQEMERLKAIRSEIEDNSVPKKRRSYGSGGKGV